jgi:hypothetical protein
MKGPLIALVVLGSLSGTAHSQNSQQTGKEQDDRALNAELGLTPAICPRSTDCMAELTNLTQRRARLLVAYSLF